MEEQNPTKSYPQEKPELPAATKKKSHNMDVRSAEVQEIIGRPPHWLVRGGIMGFFGVLALVLVAASVIKYPEVINAPLRLTAINEPKTVESKINGKIVKLFYQNKTHVVKGQVLGWMESTARPRNVLELSAEADSMYGWLKERDFRQIRSVHIEQFSGLGELQAHFQTFEEAYRTFITFLPGGFYSKKKHILEQEMSYTQQLLKKLKEQKEIQKINLKISKEEYDAQKQLAKKDLTAPLDLARAESKVAASRLPLQQTESAIINNRAAQTAKQQELMELGKKVVEQKAVFRQALSTLKSAIDTWKAKYLVTAPVAGKLIYAGIIQENQTLQPGQKIAYIKPDNTHFFGEMAISQRSFGKIYEGQKVLVRFSGYPYQEFGSVRGTIDYLSGFPVMDSVFVAKVRFPGGLTTNYGKKLSPTNGMSAQAEIITQDMYLLRRIYNNLTKGLR